MRSVSPSFYLTQHASLTLSITSKQPSDSTHFPHPPTLNAHNNTLLPSLTLSHAPLSFFSLSHAVTNTSHPILPTFPHPDPDYTSQHELPHRVPQSTPIRSALLMETPCPMPATPYSHNAHASLMPLPSGRPRQRATCPHFVILPTALFCRQCYQ